MLKKIIAVCLVLLLIAGCTPTQEASPSNKVTASDNVTPTEQSVSEEPTLTPTETPAVSDEPKNNEAIERDVEMLNEGNHQPPEGFDVMAEGIESGTLTEVEYFSKTTDATRKCYVYTPAGYDPSVTYPVLYLLHGIGGVHNEWLGGDPNEILSNLIASGEAPPMIAVFPNVRAMQNDGYPSDMLGQENIDAFDNFINDLRDDLMPFIKENYPVSEVREETAIAGLSMGGRESLYIGLSMPETFGYIGAFSPAPGLLAEESLNYPGQFTPAQMTLPEEYKGNTLILICNGNQDGVVHDVPNDYHKALRDNGILHAYYTIDGGHDFGVWRNGLYYFARSIFS